MDEQKLERLIASKRRFFMRAIILIFIFYFSLPLSIIFIPDLMNQTSIIPGMTWAWAYGFLQIPMTWLVGWVYHMKAKEFDEQLDKLMQEELS